jgi:deaminated glutathione amidase
MKIAVCQITSVLDYKENLKKISKAASYATSEGAQALFLPECFYSMSDGLTPTPHLIEKDNEHYCHIQSIAKKYGVALLGGSAATSLNGKIVNRAYNFSETGEDLGHYDKRHLFSCDIEKEGRRKKIDEADIYTAGERDVLLSYGDLKIGLGICFDLRYPEMSRQYTHSGANLLTYSSAFTVPTGKAHWYTLIRARAIENQSFVIAAAQWGRNNERIQTYGHSMVVSPWGDVLMDLEEGEKTSCLDLDLSLIQESRDKIKVF